MTPARRKSPKKNQPKAPKRHVLIDRLRAIPPLVLVLWSVAIALAFSLVLVIANGIAAGAPSRPITILVVGDSNSISGQTAGSEAYQRWPSLLETDLMNRYPKATYVLENSSVAGISSSHVASDLATYSLQYEPDVVLMLIGSNDVSSWGSTPPKSGWPSSEASSAANLELIVRGILAQSFVHERNPIHHPTLILMAPPVAAPATVGSDMTGLGYPARGHYAYGRPRSLLIAYQRLLNRIGKKYDLTVVDTWDVFAAQGWSGTQNTETAVLFDGVHLGPMGQAVLATQARQALEKHLTKDGRIAEPGIRARIREWWHNRTAFR